MMSILLTAGTYAESKLINFIKLNPVTLESTYNEYPLSDYNLYLDNSITEDGVVKIHRIDILIQVNNNYLRIMNVEDSFLYKESQIIPIRNKLNQQYSLIILNGTTDKGGGRMGEINYQVIVKIEESSVFCSEPFKYFLDDDNYLKGPIIQEYNGAIQITNAIHFFDDTIDDGSYKIVISDEQGGYMAYKFGSKTKPNIAVLIDSKVRIRSDGNLQAVQLGYLNKDDIVEILEMSNDKMKIGDMNDFWYRVKRLSDGLTGWTYGAFLKIQ